jgi:hypothetical protein
MGSPSCLVALEAQIFTPLPLAQLINPLLKFGKPLSSGSGKKWPTRAPTYANAIDRKTT